MTEGIIMLFGLIILIFSVIIHEVSHGAVAYSLGDPTAKAHGRLTLNPIPHIDLYGSIILPMLMVFLQLGIIFGYAKPVPINTYYLKNQKWGPALVAAAGPGSNFIIAIIIGLLYRLAPLIFNMTPEINQLFIITVITNLYLGVFNSIPIPPLDGFQMIRPLFPSSISRASWYQFLEQNGLVILLIVVILAGEILVPIVGFLARLILGI